MANVSTTLKKVPAMSLVALVVAASLAVAWASPAAGGQAYAEAQMQVVTEGLTAGELLQQQADLSRWLASELPSAALLAPIRVQLTREEIDAVDQADRMAVPLKIGLVKAMAPSVEVFGLSRAPSDRQPRRGASALAQPTRDGGFVWAIAVTTKGAGAIRLHVEDLSLPRNAALYLYSRDGQAYGPYTADGPNRSGEFWTATIFGSEAILQLRLSGPAGEADLRDVSLRVSEAGLITEKYAGGLTPTPQAPPPRGVWPCGNPSCVVDATCNTTEPPAAPAKLAVAKMEWIQGAFIYSCSGGLIADNNPTQDNFFLTANHCVSKNNNAQNVNFYWRFATSTCEGTCPTNSNWQYQTSGSTVAKSGRKGDFTLLHLNSAPPSGSVFLGWSTADIANSNGTDLWRISNPNFGPQVYSKHRVDTSAPTCSGWPRGERIYSRDIRGATDGGSSGSPVVNASSQIVGQLSGACGFNVNNPCDAVQNATVDGAFAFYYLSVKPILNP